MSDFYQNGGICTIHNLTNRPIEQIETELKRYSELSPIGLVLPSLFSELEGPALEGIVDELCKVDYLKQIVIGIDRSDREQFKHALKYFSRLPQDHQLLWNDGPRLQAIDKLLQKHNLAPTELGKGRNVWYCFGYIHASKKVKAVALHDCDITTYKRDMLAKLVYPVVHPGCSFQFSKGYYARVANNKINGRVTRLLVTPLLRSLKKVLGHGDFLEYLDSFRYPLAGEFAMRSSVVRDIRIPNDWGLEMGVLSEMKRSYSENQICQVEIADTYDHKHQDLSPADAAKGLNKMSGDIAKSLYRKLAIEGQIFSTETFRTIKATYYRTALDAIEQYASSAYLNGIEYDRHQEQSAVEAFAQSILTAGNDFLDIPMATPFMPSWTRVSAAIPEIKEMLTEAVEEDRKELLE
ncbi:hypothetical protein [Persicirhabdus sediminis]|uniref:Glucosyl-3-phosphoglycerate synthase n=1 Tax=Persicirhabdus sediminis TaxID=454144 RepID=A0A8J7ME32_9BACT|nr:hypothetical protein [Persicirhabdus sediminis]MBK1790987.1 hypothetical protein [Persicirhabdus sediminis]